MRRVEFENAIADVLGDDFVRSYIERSSFTEGTAPIIYPWSHVAADRLRERASGIIQKLGVAIGPAEPEHLKPRKRK